MILVWALGAVALRLTLAAPQQCGSVTPSNALSAADAAAGWIERVQKPDGSYIYEYNMATTQESSGYNAVRHAGVTMALYQSAALTGDMSTLPGADRGLQWMQDHLIEGDGWSALEDPTDRSVELGSTALMLAGLEQRRIATGNHQYDSLMHELGQFILLMQQPDGSMLSEWSTNTDAPIAGSHSLYFTGEAFWALTMMQTAFPGEDWDHASKITADYISTRRDKEEDVRYPPWSDQWATYGLAEMTTWTKLDEAEIAYARSLAERYGFMTRFESQRRDTALSKALQGPETRSAGMGTWLEALDSLWRISQADPRLAGLSAGLSERAECAAAMLVGRQVTAQQAAHYPQPELAEGAWQRDDETRMDDQQHALSGLLRVRMILLERQRP